MKFAKFYLSWLLVLMIWQSGKGQNSGTTAAAFLKLGAGARATGMGSAFTGISDDATAIYWNPAGLGFTRRWELSFNYQRLYGDLEYQAFFYAQRVALRSLPSFKVGLGIIRLGTRADWNSTDPKLGLPPVSAEAISDLAVLLPLSSRLDWLIPGLAVGGTYKYLRSKLASYTSHAQGLDFGIIYKTDFGNRWFWSLGACGQNLGLQKVKFNHTPECLPLTWRIGSAVKYYLSDNQDLTVAYDLIHTSENAPKHNVGLEYWLHLGSRRLGFRAGYRFLAQDLGRLALSASYGFDFTPSLPNAVFSQVDYALNNYDNQILGNVNSAGFSLEPANPEPFKRLRPESNARFDNSVAYHLTWQKAVDYDDHDQVNYFVVVDPDSPKIASVKQNAATIIRQLVQKSSKLAVLFHALTSDTRTTFSHTSDSDLTDFYWSVIAFDRHFNVTIATGSDEIGKFSNRNLPDIKPVMLGFSPANRLDSGDYQGQLEVKIVGQIKSPCQVVVYDSTEARTLASMRISRLAGADTFIFRADWYARLSGSHRLSVIADSGNAIAERNEDNNTLSCTLKTIPRGQVSVPDTVQIEELKYSHIELPTVPFIFFEANSTELAQNSRTRNETDPDSVLKLLGQRLKKDFPGLKITLRGFFDSNSESPYQSGKRLSDLRAQKIKEKIVTFGAQPTQIVLPRDHNDQEPRLERQSFLIPPEEQAMVSEENRRVEIRLEESLPPLKKVAYEKSFFAPQRITRKLAEVFSKKIQFSVQIQTTVPLKNLSILIRDYQSDPFPIKILEVDDLGRQTNLHFNLDWNGIKDTDQLIPFNKPYFYQVLVTDSLDNEFFLPQQSFYLARDVIVKEKRIFALAQFNQVAPLHQFYLEQLEQVEDMMKRDDRIRVRFFGHTDSIGTKERNDALSADRAGELASWLARSIDYDYGLNDAQKKILKTRIDNPLDPNSTHWAQRFQFGKGEHFPLVARDVAYGSNSSPQGRTLNRRVDIEIYRIEACHKPRLPLARNITFHPWHRGMLSGSDQRHFAHPDHREPDEERYSAALAPEIRPYMRGESLATGFINSYRGKGIAPENEIPPDGIREEFINRITCLEIQGSILWLGTELGLLKWNLDTDQYRIFDVDLRKYQRINALKYDPIRHCLWVGTQKGLRQLIGNRWHADFTISTGLAGNRISKILLNDTGTIILGTNEGLSYFDGQASEIPGSASPGLIDDQINDIFQASTGMLWVATNKGVSFRTVNDRWQPFWGNIYLPSDSVLCLDLTNPEEKWLGTAKGLRLFDRNDHPLPFNTDDDAEQLRQIRILALTRDRANRLWCATAEGLFSFQNRVWYHYDAEDGLPASFIQAILPGPDHKKYLGTRGGGVVILE